LTNLLEGGSAGIDEQGIAEFEKDLSGNLYKLWNRMVSGSYLPPPAQKRMRQQIRGWHLARRTGGTLQEFSAPYNAILRGWWNYYGSF
jgi:hypothetical protein